MLKKPDFNVESCQNLEIIMRRLRSASFLMLIVCLLVHVVVDTESCLRCCSNDRAGCPGITNPHTSQGGARHTPV